GALSTSDDGRRGTARSLDAAKRGLVDGRADLLLGEPGRADHADRNHPPILRARVGAQDPRRLCLPGRRKRRAVGRAGEPPRVRRTRPARVGRQRGAHRRRGAAPRSPGPTDHLMGIAMNDRFDLTEDQRLIRELARTIARERVAPHAAHYDATEAYPEASIRAISDAGFYSIWLPEQYGGTN